MNYTQEQKNYYLKLFGKMIELLSVPEAWVQGTDSICTYDNKYSIDTSIGKAYEYVGKSPGPAIQDYKNVCFLLVKGIGLQESEPDSISAILKVWQWNDAPERKLEDVIKALQNVLNYLNG